ncbi:3-phosphoshikimate 1-carboxyvinyltransferase [Salisediminibacterium halotolerans]|uniref:3-phosphoshikimate 1-carboxyvinyltransferase n=1 Tax=Salisediminibacterium halotolerans TaxID=517425 RepID=A0A1H9P1M0_9BACI|nr:3-phosphoshikimate 1-carboxyvinyltransferase [Salisediminibacterium haloalkalitolerans]SER42088.1 3-phosphoshikimate 1-carboxyvinyltransferase [Salisediminibacterium haloalkalitolerans]
MSEIEMTPIESGGLQGMVKTPGDKSISHRAVLFGSMAEGITTIRGFLKGEDCYSTIECMKQLGVNIVEEDDEMIIYGKGTDSFREPEEALDVGNSGTTIRLLSGLLAGLPKSVVLVGDKSIAKRPMSRVTGPLKMMNASIDGRVFGEFTPIHLRGGRLRGIHYVSPVASAQVKSALLLAGLNASGKTTVDEPSKSRDHTERMLKSFGVDVTVNGTQVTVEGDQHLNAADVDVPGDISSAAFILAAGLMVPDSCVKLPFVGVNPTRTGILDVLEAMGANVELTDEKTTAGEPVADLHVQTSSLKATTIAGGLIPRLIDEIPVIAVLATQAAGTTVIKDAAELKVKETNRIDTVVSQLKQLGANIEATPDGMIIQGPTRLSGGTVKSFGDHRVGMAMALCGLISTSPVTVEDTDAIAVSYPGFFDDLKHLRNR